MVKLLLFISTVIIIIQFGALASINKKINSIKNALDDVICGNTNRRVRLNNNAKSIRDLTNNINDIIENMCKIDNEKNKQTIMMKKMISNISHDFKTPLTTLIGYIELIKETDDLNAEDVREYLDIIHNKAYYLSSTLDDFFYLSRLESKDEHFNIEYINLTDIIKEQIVFFYNDFKSLNIVPTIDIPQEDIFVSADKISVNRILNNLFSNSLKYGKDGDKVGISINQDNKYVYVEVWDNGKGIPDKDIPLIFERLYTVEDSRNANLSGNGIGLSIVKQLVINNKGTISVKSIPHERTSFVFSLLKA